MADVFYRRLDERRGLLAKKCRLALSRFFLPFCLLTRATSAVWMSGICILGGVLALLTGLLNPTSPPSFIALISVLAFVVEAGNGACCESSLALSTPLQLSY